MLRRKAYENLIAWKNAGERKALLVDGARQIGKTYLIEEFARREYDNYVKIDFIQNADAAASISESRSARQVLERVSLMLGKPIGSGRTLFFFDEVQKFPDIVTYAKYLVEDGRFAVAMSGSMLGVELTHVKSFPVGYLHVEHMFPMTFEEFCWSQNVPDSVVSQIATSYRTLEPLDPVLHKRLIDLVRLYLVIGGMPAAVQRYIDEDGDLGAVRATQEDLVELYCEDISKYAGNRTVQVKAIYDALPGQLNKENKRFELRSLQQEAKFDRFANDFAWLVGANAALKTTNVTEPKFMLERSVEENRFKLYLSDIGMLFARYRQQVALAALAGARSVNFGAVYENFVAQELAAARVPLHYYHNSRKGEVDFLVETDGDTVVPVEVKSGKDYKLHTALSNLLGTAEYGIARAIVLSEANVSIGQRAGKPVLYLPLYMAGLVAAEASEKTEHLVVAPPRFDEWR